VGQPWYAAILLAVPKFLNKKCFIGDGHVVVNGQVMTDYFPRLRDRAQITEPLGETGTAGTLNVFATVKGGGLTGQTQAIRHGISKALVILNPEYKPSLKAGILISTALYINS